MTPTWSIHLHNNLAEDMRVKSIVDKLGGSVRKSWVTVPLARAEELVSALEEIEYSVTPPSDAVIKALGWLDDATE